MLANLAAMAKGAAGSESDRPASGPSRSVLPVEPPAIPRPAGSGARSPRGWAESTEALLVVGDAGGGLGDDSPPRTLGDAGNWLFMGAVGFVGGQILSAVILFFVAALNGHLSQLSKLAALTVPPAWIVIGGLVGLWIGFLGAVLLASRLRGTGSIVRDMGLRIMRWDPLIGIGAGLVGQFILVNLLYLPFEHFNPKLSQELQQPAKHLTGGFPGVDLAVIAALTVLVVPVVEELFFRGLVLRGFLRLFRGAGRILGPALAVITTGVVFGLAHVELLELLGLASFGIVLSVMAYKFKRLGPSIFAHATFNLIAILSIAFQSGTIH